MNTEFKPGVVCYIADSSLPENIGRPVELVSFHGICPEYGREWICKSRGPLKGIIEGWGIETTGTRIICAECDLRPIGGVPIEDEVPDEVAA